MARPDDRDLDCSRALWLIDARADEELATSVAKQLAAHAERCDRCRGELELADTIHRELARMPRFDLPGHVVDAARRRARDRNPRVASARPSAWIRPAWAALAATAVVLAFVAIAVFMPGSYREKPTPSAAEVARATADARLAFALIADATDRAEHELRDSVLRERILATAVRGISKTLRLQSNETTGPDSEPTPIDRRGGST